eukprot:scaffold574_cov190-Amphora_coffeaeformis.AAC.9
MADFWLDDDDDAGLGVFPNSQAMTILGSQLSQSQQLSQQLSQSQTNPFATHQAPAFLCETCGATDGAVEDDDGILTCKYCYTQSQTQQSTALDYDEVMGLAAKTGGRIQQNRKSTGGDARDDNKDGPKLRGRVKQPLENLDRTQTLPTLAVCLKTFQAVLYKATVNVAQLLEEKWNHDNDDHNDDNNNLQTTLLQIVQRIWFGYLRAWHLGAAYYGPHYPTIRFAFRDFFLPPTVRVALYKVVAAAAAQQEEDKEVKEEGVGNKEEDDEKQASDTDGEYSATNYPQKITSSPQQVISGKRKVTEHSFNSQKRVKTNSNNNNSTAPPTDFTLLMYQMTLVHRMQHDKLSPQQASYGYCREAALLLQPSMTLLVSILYTATMRAGVAAHELVGWIQQGRLKGVLGDHVVAPLSNNNIKSEPGWVLKSFFEVATVPSVRVLEHQAKLLLVAAGVTPLSVWRGGLLDKQHATETISKDDEFSALPVTSIPSLMAQCAADLGLGQDILRTSLYLVGLEQQQSTQGTILFHASHIQSLPQILAVLVCATVLTTSEWSFTTKIHHNKHSTTAVPWNERDMTRLNNGDAAGYVDFYTSFTAQASLVPEFTDLLRQQEVEQQANMPRKNLAVMEDDEDEKFVPENKDQVRACSVAMLGVRHEDDVNYPLRRLVFQALSQKKRGKKVKRLPTLTHHEDILIDFVAFTCHVPRRTLRMALRKILFTKHDKLRKPVMVFRQPMPSPIKMEHIDQMGSDEDDSENSGNFAV